MTVNNVNTLPPLGTAQAGQSAAKSGEAVKESFDRLIAKMGDQLAGMKQTTKTAETAVQVQAPTRTEQKNVQETARPKDEPREAGTDKADADGKTDIDRKTDADGKTDTDKAADTDGKTDIDKTADADGKTEEAGKSQEEEISADDAAAQKGFGLMTEVEADGVLDAGMQAAVEEAADGIVQKIADLLDIPLEKVEKAMEALGFTMADLFDPNNMKRLLLNLTGNTDEMALVTDGTLYDNLQDIFRTVQDTLKTLQSELGMNEEEVKALIEQVGEEQKSAAETTQTVPETIGLPETGEPEAKESEASVEGMKDYTVSVQKESGAVQIKVTVDDKSGEKHVNEQLTDTKKTETQPVLKNESMADTGHKGEGQTGEQNGAGALLQHLTGAGLAEKVETPAEVPVYTEPTTNQIMEQVVEYMKVNIRPETQELEMQLHPANLGTVHVQLASRNGVITAQFAAQNETVKAVLETQMIQLKEQFEEQGIKVEAVEVTVANHGFGEQLKDGQEAAEQEREAAKKGSRRIRLNLDELEEGEIEELDDSERIAVEMMQANGSTVNYMA